jgi:two-component system, NarL family, nitrate/nitrite response regulator NarL
VAEKRILCLLSAHSMCRRALSDLLARKGWHVIECTTLTQLSASARKDEPGVIVIDLDHAEQDGATLLGAVRALAERLIPIGTALRQAASLDKLDEVGIETRGLDAALAKLLERRRASAELARHFRLWQRITPRQRSVMRQLSVGRNNRSIAATMSVGERAIKAHVSSLLVLFGLDNRTELALLACEAGLKP